MSTFDAANLSTSGGSQNPTVTITPSAIGNLLVLQVRMNNLTATISSVTDDRGNTWAAPDALDRSNACDGQMWWTLASSTSLTTVTVALSASVGNTLAISSYVSTLGGTLGVHAHNVGHANSAAVNSGNAVTTVTCIVVTGVSLSPNTDTNAWDSPWTKRTGTTQRASIADQLDVGAGTYAGTETIAAEDWVCNIIAFAPAATTKAPPPYQRPFRFFRHAA